MYCTCVPQDGGYTLRGGPLDALIAYAASTTSAGVYSIPMMLQSMCISRCIIWVSSLSFPTDMCVLLCSTVKQFTEAFLLTYYTFITPEKLISKLLSRYVQRMHVCMYVCMCAASLPHYTPYCQIVEYLTLLCTHTCGSISLASVPPENRWAVTICCVECDYRFVVVVWWLCTMCPSIVLQVVPFLQAGQQAGVDSHHQFVGPSSQQSQVSAYIFPTTNAEHLSNPSHIPQMWYIPNF